MRQRRLLELVKDYNCEILYYLKKANVVVDALSRRSYGGVAMLKEMVEPLRNDIIRSEIEIVTGKLANLTIKFTLLEDIREELRQDDFLLKKLTLLQNSEDADLSANRVCVLVETESWSVSKYLPLMEFTYNNSYQATIGMAPFEMLYGHKCRTPLHWDEVGERQLSGPNTVREVMEAVEKIRQRVVTDQNH
ncbi:uncharacterized protein LOC133779128 [Humulus lupulus]|uniref:uncharacterized protein LOC133779128 n=1 Tax=Humulus lupulus TaxID=3486 RepID=UPI002B404E93|nr:uncharacterized protein LOC133779128 [Humulus lupulus]